jgi:outer membrane murein-binding lipoprotein Lpp
MAIQEDLRAAIEKNLSAEVGSVIRARLEWCEKLEKEVQSLNTKIETLSSENKELLRRVYAGDSADQRREKAEKAEADARTAQVDLKVQQVIIECANLRITDMKELVKSVFANNQYKYLVNENGMAPVSIPQGTYTQTQPFSRSAVGTGEGSPPPAPSGSPGQG